MSRSLSRLAPLTLLVCLSNMWISQAAASASVTVQTTVVNTCSVLTPSVVVNVPNYSASTASVGSGVLQVKCTQGTAVTFSNVPGSQQSINRVPAAPGGTLTFTMSANNAFPVSPDGARLIHRTLTFTIPAGQWQAPAGNYTRSYTLNITFS